MWSKFLDKNFWFSQPPIILTNTDQYLGYFFAGCVVLAILIRIIKRFIPHKVKAQLLNKFFHLFLTVGICGMIWYGFRYENTPIFAARSWAGLMLLIGLVWGLFIAKYLIFNFSSELKDYEHQVIKNKYLPGVKTR